MMQEMSIDKELYKKAFEQYREWNKAELIYRIRNAGKLLPEEGWQQYVDLWKFCWKLSPKESKGQRKLKLKALEMYFERIQKAIAGRGRDWPDIEALLIEQRGKLNDKYIDNWLTQFAEVLDKPDLIIEIRKIRNRIEEKSKK